MKRKVIQNYTLCDVIGEGSFGKVFLSINNLTNQKFAIKVIPLQKFQQNSRLEQCSANEVRNLTRIESSPYIIKFIEMLKTPNNFYFVYEFCNGKTLEAKLKEETKLSEKEALRLFSQLLEAFKVLNKYNIMHRDLKPDNIFFHNGNLKLGDFGFCKTLLREGDMTSTMLGSPIYMAPEVLKGEIYTSKADIWSLGVVLYQMLFGVCPFETNSIAKLIDALNNTQLRFPKEINPISESTKLLLKRLLTKDQFKRIDWFELLTMNFTNEEINQNTGRTLSRKSSQKSLNTIQKKLNENENTNLISSLKFLTSLTPTATTNTALLQPFPPPLTNQNRQTDTGFIFKKKSDSSRHNPQSQKIIKADHTRSIKSSMNDQQPPVSQPVLFSRQPLENMEINVPSTPAIQRKFSITVCTDTKRKQLLNQHNNCLLAVRTAMSFIKYHDPHSTLLSYVIFKHIQSFMQKIIDAITPQEFDLDDVMKTLTEQLKSIKIQTQRLQEELMQSNINPYQLNCSYQQTLRQKFTTQSNKRLWYEMITFITQSKLDPKASEIEWNSVINSYLM